MKKINFPKSRAIVPLTPWSLDIPRHDHSKIDHIFRVAVADHAVMKNQWSEVALFAIASFLTHT